MSTPSATTVGILSFSMSATAVRLLSLPEVDEAADAREQGPADRERPYVGRQLTGVEAVDQGEAHQVDVDGGRVGLEHRSHPARQPAVLPGQLVDAPHDAGDVHPGAQHE